MPLYTYENNGKIVEVYQSMNEKHEYSEGGVAFKRVWQLPQTNSSTKILDPFDNKAFVRQLEGKHGETIGDTMDRSAELSAARADRLGKDPIKEKYYEGFKKRHRGKEHPDKVKEQCAPQVAALKELGIKVNL